MQTSARDLSTRQKNKIISQFVTLLADLRKPSDSRAFFQAFLTDTEQLVFAKRLAIIAMLKSHKSYQQIRQKLHVSSATISSVASQMEQPGIQLAIDKLELDEWADNLAKKISQLLPFAK